MKQSANNTPVRCSLVYLIFAFAIFDFALLDFSSTLILSFGYMANTIMFFPLFSCIRLDVVFKYKSILNENQVTLNMKTLQQLSEIIIKTVSQQMYKSLGLLRSSHSRQHN